MKTVHFIAIQLLVIAALIFYIQIKTKSPEDTDADTEMILSEKIDSLTQKIQTITAQKYEETMAKNRASENEANKQRLKNYGLSRINEFSKMKMNEISPFFGLGCIVVPDSTDYDPVNKVFTIEFNAGWTISKKTINDLFPNKHVEEKHASFKGKCTITNDFSEQITILFRNDDYVAAEASKDRFLKVSECLLLFKNILTALQDESGNIYSL